MNDQPRLCFGCQIELIRKYKEGRERFEDRSTCGSKECRGKFRKSILYKRNKGNTQRKVTSGFYEKRVQHSDDLQEWICGYRAPMTMTEERK